MWNSTLSQVGSNLSSYSVTGGTTESATDLGWHHFCALDLVATKAINDSYFEVYAIGNEDALGRIDWRASTWGGDAVVSGDGNTMGISCF